VRGTIGMALLSASVGLAGTASAQQFPAPPQETARALATPAAALPPLGKAAAEHQLGVGIRVFPESDSGIGAGIRYFMGANLGIQAEIARFWIPRARVDDVSVNQFNGAAIYRISEHSFNRNKLSLVPYAGAGINILRGDCDNLVCLDLDFDEDEPFEEGDENSVGVLIFGGAELFFRAVPRVSVSGEITFTSNNDRFGGGGRGSIAAHWYFK
jgi:hypothetical protein